MKLGIPIKGTTRYGLKARSSSREVRIRVPFFSVVLVGEPSPKKGLKGTTGGPSRGGSIYHPLPIPHQQVESMPKAPVGDLRVQRAGAVLEHHVRVQAEGEGPGRVRLEEVGEAHGLVEGQEHPAESKTNKKVSLRKIDGFPWSMEEVPTMSNQTHPKRTARILLVAVDPFAPKFDKVQRSNQIAMKSFGSRQQTSDNLNEGIA